MNINRMTDEQLAGELENSYPPHGWGNVAKFVRQIVKDSQNSPMLCKCPNEHARTVRKVNDDFFGCPRCGGLVLRKDSQPEGLTVEWTDCKVRIKLGWEGALRVGRSLGEPVWVEQIWLPILWNGEEDPCWHKISGIDKLITANHATQEQKGKDITPKGLTVEEIKNVLTAHKENCGVCCGEEKDSIYGIEEYSFEKVSQAIHAAQERKGKNADVA